MALVLAAICIWYRNMKCMAYINIQNGLYVLIQTALGIFV